MHALLARITSTLCLGFAATAAFAQGTLTGTVTNKTTNKPAANDTVTLIRLQQGMQESTVTHTDAHGHYTLELPDGGIHLVRVTHDKANYFGAAPPGVSTVDVAVYNALPKVSGVSTQVEELHIEGTATELHVVEVLEVQNQSAPAMTQFGPKGFPFFLPAGARIERTGAVTDGGMPVPASAAPQPDTPGAYSFLFPVRPGETQFGIFYSLPYTGSITLPLKLADQVHTLAIVLPKGMTLTPGPSTPWSQAPAGATNDGTTTWLAQNVSSSQPLDVKISGTGTLPQRSAQGGDAAPGAPGAQGQAAPGQVMSGADANAGAQVDANGNPDTTRFGGGLGKPVDPDADRYPLAKYKWWILAGLAILLAAGAGVLLRKPREDAEAPLPPTPSPLEPSHYPAAPRAAAVAPLSSVEAVLKEEFFTLETEMLQGRITADEYNHTKAALSHVLARILARTQPAPVNPPATTAAVAGDRA